MQSYAVHVGDTGPMKVVLLTRPPSSKTCSSLTFLAEFSFLQPGMLQVSFIRKANGVVSRGEAAVCQLWTFLSSGLGFSAVNETRKEETIISHHISAT